MENIRSWYLKCSPENLAPSVVLVGDPARVDTFRKYLSNARVVAQEREFKTMTGQYKSLPVSVVSTGIGAPSAAIVLEELWELGARNVVRAGTGMAMNLPLGSFLLAQGAVRMDGVSLTYLPVEFPAISDIDLFNSFRQTLIINNQPYKSGLVATSDGFYTHFFHHPYPGREPERINKTLINEMAKLGVIGVDMETSAIYAIGYYLKLKCISILLATVDGFSQSALESSSRREREEDLARIVLEGLLLHSQEVT